MSADHVVPNISDELRATLRSTTDAFHTPGHISHELLAQFIALSSQAFVVAYPDGSLGMMNAAFEELTGYSAEELKTVSWTATLTPPEWREFEKPLIEELNRTGIPLRFEKEFIRKDGSRIPVELHVHKVPTTSSELFYFSFVTDISERKKFEQHLRASEERFSSVLENSVDFIYRFNYRTQRYDYASPSCFDIVGHTQKEYGDRSLEDAMSTVHPDDLAYVTSSFAALRPKVATEIEMRLQDSDGVYRWLSNRVTLVNDENGVPLYRYGTIRDITDRKRVQEELQKVAAERAELADRQLKISETVQRSLLLTPAPDAYSGIVTHPFYQPAYDDALVGGDFYDVYIVADGLIALVVGDATGKGVAAATYTAEVKFALRAYMKEYLTDIALAVTKLNRFVWDNCQRDAAHNTSGFISLVAAMLHIPTGELTCVCTGAEPILILRQETGIVEEAGASGALLGLYEDTTYLASRHLLKAGDAIILTTDGITEAHRPPSRDESGKIRVSGFFGLEGIANALTTANPVSAAAIPALQRQIVAEAIAFAGGRQRDDICILTTKLLVP